MSRHLSKVRCNGCAKTVERKRAVVFNADGTRTSVRVECNDCRRVSVACGSCGKTLARSPSRVLNRLTYCSRECAALGFSQWLKDTNGSGINRFRNGTMVPCAICGSKFYKRPSETRKKCCSWPCALAYQKQHRVQPTWTAENRKRQSDLRKRLGSPWSIKPPVIRVCRQCGVQFRVASGKKRYEEALYCTTECAYQYRRDNNPARPWGRGPNWNQQSARARERDGYTCQRCGFHRVRPKHDVHHLRPYADFNGDYKAANALDNLVTLCYSCHMVVEGEWRRRHKAERPLDAIAAAAS